MQIILIDMVFSIDSIITAVGMAQHVEVMIAAVIVAVGVMFVASGPIAGFVARHPTTKMLALAFLLLIGVSLVADGLGFHIEKGYIYAAMGFCGAGRGGQHLRQAAQARPRAASASTPRAGNAMREAGAAREAGGRRPVASTTAAAAAPSRSRRLRPPARSRGRNRRRGRSHEPRRSSSTRAGGPEVLRLEDTAALCRPGRRGGDPQRSHRAQLRRRLSADRPLQDADCRSTPGGEGAGRSRAVGDGVTDFKVGDRVLYKPGGAYADEVAAPPGKVVKLPDGISTEVAAPLVTKGGTAHYLLFETWAAEGGRHDPRPRGRGRRGHAPRAVGDRTWRDGDRARRVGREGRDRQGEWRKHAFNSREDGWVAKVREATGGRGVDVVYDGVGKATFEASLDCLRPRGLDGELWQCLGPGDRRGAEHAAERGSLYVTRPTIGAVFRRPRGACGAR